MTTVDGLVSDHACSVAALHVDLARRELELGGDGAAAAARSHLEAAIARLRPTVADGDLPPAAREAAERWRASLSSYVLAALDLAAAGVPSATVARLLRRAVGTIE